MGTMIVEAPYTRCMDTPLIDQWLSREAALRALHAQGPGPGVARSEALDGLSGLELMERMMEGRCPTPTMAHTLDYLMVEVGPGRAVYQGTPSSAHLNPMGTVHGGWASTLLDSALGCAVHTCLPVGRAYTTAELDIKLVRAVTPQIVRLRAEAEVLHCGRQLGSARARLVDADGKLYAHASTTCLIFDLPARKTP